MDKVIDCARALGEAIVASEEYKNMQVTEQAAMSDPTVTELMARYMELKNALGDVMCQPDADPEVITRYGQEMDEVQQQLTAMPAVDAMTSARQQFSENLGHFFCRFCETAFIPDKNQRDHTVDAERNRLQVCRISGQLQVAGQNRFIYRTVADASLKKQGFHVIPLQRIQQRFLGFPIQKQRADPKGIIQLSVFRKADGGHIFQQGMIDQRIQSILFAVEIPVEHSAGHTGRGTDVSYRDRFEAVGFQMFQKALLQLSLSGSCDFCCALLIHGLLPSRSCIMNILPCNCVKAEHSPHNYRQRHSLRGLNSILKITVAAVNGCGRIVPRDTVFGDQGSYQCVGIFVEHGIMSYA